MGHCIMASCLGWVGRSHQNVTKYNRGGWVELKVASRLKKICGINFPTVVARQINLASVVEKMNT